MYEPSEHRPTQAIIHLTKIQNNIRWMKSQLAPEQKLYAVVKADAYGHGAVPVSRAAVEAGAQGLAVATVDEAIELRRAGLIQLPILVMGLTDPQGIAELLHYNLTITVSDLDFFAKAYEQLASVDQLGLLDHHQLTVHLALDTGMGRIGLTTVAELEQFTQGITAYPWVEWQGVFTHFATAGGGDPAYIEVQWARWQTFLAHVPSTVTERHYNNSAMSLWHNARSPHSTIARFGIGMYGLDPKDHLPEEASVLSPVEQASLAALQPALELVTEIIYVKEVPVGTAISYGATYVAPADEWIATLPIGYADGWLRHYQSVPVLIDGEYCPIVGTINMDQLMIRLPRYYPVGTLVTLIGQDNGEIQLASDVAREAGTIGYEICTSLSPRVPRVYLSHA